MKAVMMFESFIKEGIKASDAHDTMSAVQTIIDGKREIAFISTMKGSIYKTNNEYELKSMMYGHQNGLKSIKVRNKDQGEAWVLYRKDRNRAQKLADFAASKEGFLNDETAEEARLVGNLLDYNRNDIERYIKRNY